MLLFCVCFCHWLSLLPFVYSIIARTCFLCASSNEVNCSKTSDQSKWPLRPGLLIHINKMNNVSISQLRSYKTASISRRGVFSKYKRNKSKVYARLNKLKGCFSWNSDKERLPNGIKESPNGGTVFWCSVFCCLIICVFVFFCMLVVTFRKVQAVRRVPSTSRPTVMASRKRKFPGAGKIFLFKY